MLVLTTIWLIFSLGCRCSSSGSEIQLPTRTRWPSQPREGERENKVVIVNSVAASSVSSNTTARHHSILSVLLQIRHPSALSHTPSHRSICCSSGGHTLPFLTTSLPVGCPLLPAIDWCLCLPPPFQTPDSHVERSGEDIWWQNFYPHWIDFGRPRYYAQLYCHFQFQRG